MGSQLVLFQIEGQIMPITLRIWKPNGISELSLIFENFRFVEGCGDQHNELKWENIWASMKEEPFKYDTVYTL